MNLATPLMRELAERLLAEECDGNEGTDRNTARAVCSKLGALLIKLTGAAGYRSLLSRALSLAQTEEPGLKDAHVGPAGTLDGIDVVRAKLDNEEFARCERELIAQLLGLLTTFIGETLTLQLVKEAWPAIDTRSS